MGNQNEDLVLVSQLELEPSCGGRAIGAKRNKHQLPTTLYKVTNPFPEGWTPSWLAQHLLVAPPLNTLTLAIKFQHVNLGKYVLPMVRT